MSAGQISPEMRRRMAAEKEARRGRSGRWTRADLRRVEKILRKTKAENPRRTISLDRAAKRDACRRFGISGKRFRELGRKLRREWRGGR